MRIDWSAGDLESLARDDAREGARDVEYFRDVSRASRDAAIDRERAFRISRDDMRQRACAELLAVPLTHAAILKAQRLARAAERVEEWRADAEEASHA